MRSFLERLLLLKRAPLFSEISTDDLRVVVEELREEACFAGERVFDIHDHGDQMYIVLSGKVGISLDADPRTGQFVRVLGAGECFGEMSLLDDQPRSATAHVLEDAVLLSLTKETLREIVASYPELAFGLLRSLSLRLRQANKLINAPATADSLERGSV